jgi:hypothetical protein
MLVASSEQESSPRASSFIRDVCLPQAALKFILGYRLLKSFCDTTKARITMLTFGFVYCFASIVPLVASV